MPHACATVREAVSARADGEESPLDGEALDRHLAVCRACAGFAAAVADVGRRLRVNAADDVPDLTDRILASVTVPDRSAERARLRQLRAVLAFAGVVQFVLALPVLLTPDALGAHVAREVGVFQLALATGFLVAARRPARASGLLPVAVVVAALLLVAAVVDVLTGAATLVGESVHLLEIVGTALVWALDRHPGTLRAQPTGVTA